MQLRCENTIGVSNPRTITTISQRGAPASRLDGSAAYTPPTASIATNGGQSGSAGQWSFLRMPAVAAVALFISASNNKSFAAFVLLIMNFIRIDTVLSWVQLKSLTT